MRLVRSFPATIPFGRAYVVDDAERLINTGYSYRGLVGMGDVVHLDWDQAVDRSDLVRFRDRAMGDPDRARVVPVLVEPAARPGLASAVWNCRVYQGSSSTRYCTPADDTADLFGFGMVYLPGKAVLAFEAEWRDDLDIGAVRFDDIAFSGWYSRRYGPAVIDWDLTCVHLHYSAAGVFS